MVSTSSQAEQGGRDAAQMACPLSRSHNLVPSNTPPSEAPIIDISLSETETRMKLPQDLKLIILMGATGSGKSTFINSVAGSALSVSTSLTSCTQQVAYVDLDLKDGTHLRLIDTPGFDDSTRADIEILEEIATALKIWGEDGLMIHGAIYLHRISDVRMSGSARKCLSTFLNICGNKAMQHVSIVTNMWGSVSHSEGEAREAELFQDSLFFKNALTAGAQTLRNDNPPHSAHEILLRAVRPTPVQLLIQKELIEDKKGILQTTAGVELDREMAEKRAQHEAELLELNQGYEYAQQQQDLETQEELEEEREILKKKIEGMKSMIERMQERKKIQARREHRHAPSPQYAGRSTATTRALNTEPSRAVVAEERSPWATNQMLAGPVALQSRHFPRDDLRSQYTFTEHSRPGNRGIEEIQADLTLNVTDKIRATLLRPPQAHHPNLRSSEHSDNISRVEVSSPELPYIAPTRWNGGPRRSESSSALAQFRRGVWDAIGGVWRRYT